MDLVELEYIKIFSNSAKVLLPVGSKDLNTSMVKLKYPSALRPQIIKTNSEENVDFTFNIMDQNIPEEGLPILLSMIKANIMKQHPGFKFNEQYTIDSQNKNLVMMEYAAPAIDGIMYYIMGLVKINKQVIQAIYNCDINNKDKYKKIMLRSINSIRGIENE